MESSWAAADSVAEYLIVDGNATVDELQQDLNAAALDGWRVAHVLPRSEGSAWLLLERPAILDTSDPSSSADWPPPS
jgi:hypothetical protein